MVAIAAFPWDIVEDMQTFALVTTGMFVWAYFTLDIIATDFANPFGFHPHCAPFDALLARMEDASYSILMGFPVEGGSAEDSASAVRVTSLSTFFHPEFPSLHDNCSWAHNFSRQ
jgi:predicted membrane chloride channel (bestrophin family)